MISNIFGGACALFPTRGGGPKSTSPETPWAAPRSRSSQRFPQSWGRIVRPEPKGFAAPRHLQPPVKASANPRNPRIFDPTSKIPYLWGPPVFRLSDGSQNFRVPASASVARGQKRRQMRPRHSHSEPDSEPPGLIFSSSAAQEVNLSTGTLQLWKTWCQSTTKPRKIGVLGVPPSIPPYPRTRVSRPGPEIDLKYFGGAYALSPASWGP